MTVSRAQSTPERRSTVLLVDDDRTYAGSLARALAGQFDIRHAATADAAAALLSPLPDAALLDVRLSDRSDDRQGVELLERLRREYPQLPVLMITGFGDIDIAVECVKLGATDFIEKRGANHAEIRTRLGQAIDRAHLEVRVVDLEHDLQLVEPRALVGDSAAMSRVREAIRAVAADGNVSVLLRGETGTGKEVVARAIHASGWRSTGSFVALPICALPSQTVEAELFGYEPGAFTDARQRHRGYIERADRGVLFLDEIGEIDGSLQVKLLRVLEEREFQRLGGSAPQTVDVQIVAATNADLESMVRERRFREDLYFRLKVREIVLPPLRERLEDVPLLARHFLEVWRRQGRRVGTISESAQQALVRYSWPGNVRQLRNVLESAVLDASSRARTQIEDEDLPAEVTRRTPAGQSMPGMLPDLDAPGFSLASALARTELQLVTRAIDAAGGRLAEAWQRLGTSDRFVMPRRVRRLLVASPELQQEFPALAARFLAGGTRGGRSRTPARKRR